MSERMDINRLLLEMRSLKSQSTAFNGPSAINRDQRSISQGVQGVNGPSFTDVMSQAVSKVNEVQKASSSTTNAYLNGDSSVDITDVMIASQKSGVAFDAMLQVRNKVVEAYRDVMNMPI